MKTPILLAIASAFLALFPSDRSPQWVTERVSFPSVAPSLVYSTQSYITGPGSITHEVDFGVNGDWSFDRWIPTFDDDNGRRTLVSIDMDLWLGLHRDFGIEVTSSTGRAAFYTSWDQPFNPPSDDDLGGTGPAWWQARIDLPTLPMYLQPITRWHERVGAVYASAGSGFAFDRTHTGEKKTSNSYTDQATLAYFQGVGTLTRVPVVATHHPSMWVTYTAGTTWQPNGHSFNPGRLAVTYNFTTL